MWPARGLSNFISAASVRRLCKAVRVQLSDPYKNVGKTIAKETYVLTQVGSGAKCLLDVYYWGAGLAVTGRIRDIGQNILQSSLQTRSSVSRSHFQIFFFIAFFDESFIRNIIYNIILCINYIIIIFINDKNGGMR